MDRLKPPGKPMAPPPRRRAFSVMGGAVSRGGDKDDAQALAALFRVDADLERALTHGFHPYAARLHPSIARGAVTRWSRPGDRVVDPFCGSGTVLVEAYAGGRSARGIDASPLAIELARTRSTTLGHEGRARLVALAAGIAEEAGELARTRKRPELPTWSDKERPHFHPHVLLELLTLRQLVMGIDDDDPAIPRALRMCFSSLLVKFMKAGPGAPRDGEDKRIARGAASRLLAGRARELAAGLEEVERLAGEGTDAPIVELGDARRASVVASRSVDLIVSSPPYAGTYDYAGLHEVRFRWLNLPTKKLRETQIGERTVGLGLGADALRWGEARRAWMAEIARMLRTTGRAVLVVGDGVVGNYPEDARIETERAAKDVGLSLIAWASERRPAQDRRLTEIFGKVARHEHLLLIGKR